MCSLDIECNLEVGWNDTTYYGKNNLLSWFDVRKYIWSLKNQIAYISNVHDLFLN